MHRPARIVCNKPPVPECCHACYLASTAVRSHSRTPCSHWKRAPLSCVCIQAMPSSTSASLNKVFLWHLSQQAQACQSLCTCSQRTARRRGGWRRLTPSLSTLSPQGVTASLAGCARHRGCLSVCQFGRTRASLRHQHCFGEGQPVRGSRYERRCRPNADSFVSASRTA
jgi:hypothetical protein